MIIRYSYTPDGQKATMTAVNKDTSNQTTTWTFGTTLGDSGIASSQLLRSITFPDSTGGSDVVTFSYNRQSEEITLTDQRGCVHTYLIDLLGRMTDDCVTTLGSGVDGAVRRLTTAYEVRGMMTSQTSYDNPNTTAGSVVNQYQLAYNNFSQLTTDYQSHSGAVNTGSTPHVQYGYADGSVNTIRPTQLTYPNGRAITSSYGTSGGINDSCSRVDGLIDSDSTTLVNYSYLGQGTAVQVTYPQPSTQFTLLGSTGGNNPMTGDIYWGLDLFSRIVDARWFNTGSNDDVARLKYGYNRIGSRSWRQDTVATSLGQNYDELYTYDGLQRLKDMQRGALNGDQTGITSPNFGQCWTLDSTNNWTGFREAATGGAWTLNQSRTSNTVNEITGITNTVGDPWLQPAYDAAGNMTTIPVLPSGWADMSVDDWSNLTVDGWSTLTVPPTAAGYTATYDAWNRLVKLIDASTSDTVQQNQYDARNFRTVRMDYTAGTLTETRHFYYTSAWQSIEERLGASTTADRQHIRGVRYVDDLVLRDRDTTGGGTLDERLYGLQDANWNMVALIDPSAAAQERYFYSPFGWPTFLNGTMSAILSGSAISSEILFTGQFFDGGSTLHLFRNRYFDSITGRFITRDPLTYSNGPSVYAGWFVPKTTDSTGLKCCPTDQRRSASECCRDAREIGLNDQLSSGGVICCDGNLVPCVWMTFVSNPAGNDIVSNCTLLHEKTHISNLDSSCPEDTPCGYTSRPGFNPGKDPDKQECKAFVLDLLCLALSIGRCGDDQGCVRGVKSTISVVEEVLTKRKCSQYNNPLKQLPVLPGH